MVKTVVNIKIHYIRYIGVVGMQYFIKNKFTREKQRKTMGGVLQAGCVFQLLEIRINSKPISKNLNQDNELEKKTVDWRKFRRI